MFEKFYNRIILSSLVFGIIIGTTVFVSIFGVSILNPKNIDWYINLSGDPGQHILGWLAYLRSDYFFPIGLTDYLLYPNKYSIMYTDSIPLFSFIFKVLHSITGGGDFQYFGLYGLFNFIMQVTLSIIIIRKFTDNKIVNIFGSLLVVFTPILYFRIFGHHSLSSHWLILSVLAYIVYNYQIFNLKKDIIFFSIISFIASGIHFYFFPMIFGLCVMYIIYKLIETKKIILLIVPIISFLVTLLALYVYGAFYNIGSSGGIGLGLYNFNLNGFLNSFGVSKLFNKLPAYELQYEGFAYLGVGVFLLIVYIITILLFKYKNIKIIKDKVFLSLILITIFIFILVSTGGRLSLGEHVLFEIELPNIFTTFRATGRFIWVPVYIIIFSLIYLFVKITNKKYYAVLIVIVILQLIDITPLLREKSNQIVYANEKPKIALFSEDDCNELRENFSYVFIDAKRNGLEYDELYAPIYSFIKCNIPVDNFYFARISEDIVTKKRNEIYHNIYSDGNSDYNGLIMTKNSKILYDYDINAYKYKNVYLLSKKEISFLDKISSKTDFIQAGDYLPIEDDNFFIYGWSNSENTGRWSSRNDSMLIFPVDNSDRDVILSVELIPYLNEKVVEQSIDFVIDKKVVATYKMDSANKEYTIKISKENIKNNMIKLRFVLKNKISSPSDVGINDNRYLGVKVTKIFYQLN